MTFRLRRLHLGLACKPALGLLGATRFPVKTSTRDGDHLSIFCPINDGTRAEWQTPRGAPPLLPWSACGAWSDEMRQLGAAWARLEGENMKAQRPLMQS